MRREDLAPDGVHARHIEPAQGAHDVAIAVVGIAEGLVLAAEVAARQEIVAAAPGADRLEVAFDEELRADIL